MLLGGGEDSFEAGEGCFGWGDGCVVEGEGGHGDADELLFWLKWFLVTITLYYRETDWLSRSRTYLYSCLGGTE